MIAEMVDHKKYSFIYGLRDICKLVALEMKCCIARSVESLF